jgi:DNA repair photolyase
MTPGGRLGASSAILARLRMSAARRAMDFRRVLVDQRCRAHKIRVERLGCSLKVLNLRYPLSMRRPRTTQSPKGRGAVSNPVCRFERLTRETVDDGWWQDGEPQRLCTTVSVETARSVVARNVSADVPFEQSINPYRGCEHGCIYCFARPTHAYLGLSPGLDFETRLFAKENAAQLLARELSRPGYRPRPIMLGTATDPYQPIERERHLTRSTLRVLMDFNHPVAISTKSALVVRDLDILAPMAEQGLVRVGVSITTLDPSLSRIMEPRAAAPRKRLDAVRALAHNGVPVTAIAAPMIPFINDHELEHIIEAVAEAGAASASYVLLRLPLELKELFADWLRTHFPDRAARVLGGVRDCRQGELYVAEWAARMKGSGAYAEILAKRFATACRRAGLEPEESGIAALNCAGFQVPREPAAQLTLF